MNVRAFILVAALATPSLALADEPKPQNPPMSGDKTNPSPDGDKTTGNDKSMDKDKPAAKDAKLSAADTKVIAHLHHVNQMEIELSKLAQKSSNTQIKNYASTIVTDHQSADKDLMAFAKSHKLANIPADKPDSETDRQADKDMTTAVAHLKTLKGAEFDKEYLNMMVSGHDKELAKIDVSAGSANDPDLQSMLKSLKPVLQRHADQARDLQKSPQASNEMRDPTKPADSLPSTQH
jgi:putative membrane protein